VGLMIAILRQLLAAILAVAIAAAWIRGRLSNYNPNAERIRIQIRSPRKIQHLVIHIRRRKQILIVICHKPSDHDWMDAWSQVAPPFLRSLSYKEYLDTNQTRA
jgi:hypothetical protein